MLQTVVYDGQKIYSLPTQLSKKSWLSGLPLYRFLTVQSTNKTQTRGMRHLNKMSKGDLQDNRNKMFAYSLGITC